MSARLIALCLAAHPDDLEVYMGGTLAMLAAGQARLFAIIATDGEAGTQQPVHGTRRDEQRAAAAQVDCDVEFWGLPDAGLSDVSDLEDRVTAAVDRHRPVLLFAPHPSDPHPDHAALARAVAAPCWRWLPARPEVEPTHYAVIDDHHSAKRALIEAHGSQIVRPGESRTHLPDGLDILERAERRDSACGHRLGFTHAEPLVGPEGMGVGSPRLIRRAGDFIGGAR